MKKLWTTLLLLAAVINAAGCSQVSTGNDGTAEEKQSQPVEAVVAARYKLYQTENLWTFIKLDTRTGQMWQLQYTVDEEKGRFEYDLNPQPLLLAGMQPVDGRYELYPTKNMYNFILIDQIEGVTWQVQWSLDDDKRMVLPISR